MTRILLDLVGRAALHLAELFAAWTDKIKGES